MSKEERPYALDIKDRDNLDEEMTALVKGIEKNYGFMPNFLKFFKTDNQRLRAFMTSYKEVLRADSGLSELEHEMIALVCAATTVVSIAPRITAPCYAKKPGIRCLPSTCRETTRSPISLSGTVQCSITSSRC